MNAKIWGVAIACLMTTSFADGYSESPLGTVPRLVDKVGYDSGKNIFWITFAADGGRAYALVLNSDANKQIKDLIWGAKLSSTPIRVYATTNSVFSTAAGNFPGGLPYSSARQIGAAYLSP